MHFSIKGFVLVAFVLMYFTVPAPLYADLNSDQRAALQAQLDQIEREIATNQGSLTELQRQRTTLERDIGILDAKIKQTQLQIKQSDLTLRKIGTDIDDKHQAIRSVDTKLAREQQSLAQILRETRAIDEMSIPEMILSGAPLSDFFAEIDSFEQVQRSLGESFKRLAGLRTDLSTRKQELEEKQTEAEQVRQAQVLEKQVIQQNESQKKNILAVTKGQEKTYQQLIADKKKQAAAIREALFGLRDSAAISFGTAYEYAKQASAATGVRPALILAILTQESNLGQNVGSCYVTNIDTGAGVGKNSGKVFRNVMKAPRDTLPFQSITESLGRDWSNTPVSCPQSVGYGGAMGPAQFIPSTWVLYKDRIARATGQSTPDPWDGRAAVAATAFLMADNGAANTTRAGERRAALKYFAGANWNKSANAFYGDNVMDIADRIQGEIEIIGG